MNIPQFGFNEPLANIFMELERYLYFNSLNEEEYEGEYEESIDPIEIEYELNEGRRYV